MSLAFPPPSSPLVPFAAMSSSSSSTPFPTRPLWPQVSRRIVVIWSATILLLLLTLVGGYWQQQRVALRQVDQGLARVERLAYYQPQLAQQLAREVQAEAMALADDERLAQSYYWQAKLLLIEPRLKSQEASGLTLARLSANLMQPLNRPAWMARIYALLFETAYRGKFNQSLDSYLNQGLMAIEDIESAPQDSMQALADLLLVQSITLAEGQQRDSNRLTDALYTLNQAQGLLVHTRDSLGLLLSWICKGQILRELQRLDQAERQLTEAFAWARAKDSLVLMPKLYRAQAMLYGQKATVATNPEQQTAAAQRALAAAQQALAYTQGAAQYLDLGKLCHQLAQLIPEQRQPYLIKASDSYLAAMGKLLMEEKDPYLLFEVVDSYQAICSEVGQCEFLLEQANIAFRSVNEEYREARSNAEQNLYRSEQKRIKRKAQAKRSAILLGSAILLLLLGLVFWIRDQRLRLVNLRQRITARLETLQAQMNPHFLSNCLNAIEALINVNRNQEASYYLVQFSRLSRLILKQSRKAQISLTDEIKILEHYLRLERMRLDERLEFRIEVAPTLPQDEVPMPPMLLQPLVENAIWHGIQPKRGSGQLLISFHHPAPRQIRCIIEDDGIGRAASQANRKGGLPGKESVSTDIIQERLAMLRRERSTELRYIDLHDEAGQPAGTRVELTLSW